MKQFLDRLFFFTLGFFGFVIIQRFCSPGAGHHFTNSPENPAPIVTSLSGAGTSSLLSSAIPAPIVKTFRVTAYCTCPLCCGKYSDGITASGHRIRPGDKLVAAPKEYPFGTGMFIPGYSDTVVIVEDRGGAIKGNKLDVLFPTHKEALEWGVRFVEVRIYPCKPNR
jgi:3D (Asp-Asp-Asp) domain-containing protein